MARLLPSVDAILRPDAFVLPTPSVRLAWFLVPGCLYGAVMGSFGSVAHGDFQQALYSAIKVPLLLAATFSLALPSFFVLNTFLGLRDDFAEVFRALIRAQVGTTMVLGALAPYTVVWYFTSGNYFEAVLFNGVMFGIASVTGQLMLRRDYRALMGRNPLHRTMMHGWLVIFAFVGIQMGWTLRPFIGDPATPTRFFRESALAGNAYETVFALISNVMRGWLE